MAAIDKLYITSDQWRQMRGWVAATEQARKDAGIELCCYLGPKGYLSYLEDDFKGYAPVWNIGGKDKEIEWLKKNCPKEYFWVHEDLAERE